MEQNNLLPDFDRIGAAFETLSTETLRIRNIEPVQQYIEVIRRLEQVQESFKTMQRFFNRRLIAIKNTTI
ncbi:hypothetical protein F5Y09DRAFT_303754 [Xylaria sp. FL1042]|nr:hypothetical protein F5Y09DRAFT_303754 [Xylaria sp. FL1042]